MGASAKPKTSHSIGYKGHGTKLFFDSLALTVVTRAAGDAGWTLATLPHPAESDGMELEVGELPAKHALRDELQALGLLGATGTASPTST